MKRKNAIILGVVSLISLSLVSGILLANNSSNYLKASADDKYTITLTKANIQNVAGSGTYRTFDLVGVTGKSGQPYSITGCCISNADPSNFSLGGDHLFTNTFSTYSDYIQIQAGLLDTGLLVDYYMTGTDNGTENTHFFQESWLDEDSEPGIYSFDIYISTDLDWLHSLEIDSIVFEYMC